VVQPVIVVFGGTLVSLLVTFSLPQLAQALQSALERGIRGGTAPQDMIRAMLKVCDMVMLRTILSFDLTWIDALPASVFTVRLHQMYFFSPLCLPY